MREAVLQAALDSLAENGASGVTMNDVARRSGVHATSVQRRWGSRDKLILDALLSYSRSELTVPDAGSVREDLILFGNSVLGYLASPLGEALVRAMAAAEDDAETDAWRAEFWQARYESARVMIARGVARGELSERADALTILELLVAPLHFRALLARRVGPDRSVEQLVDAILHEVD